MNTDGGSRLIDEASQSSSESRTLVSSFAPNRALLICAHHYGWLYPDLMQEMRKRFGTSFVLIAADDRVQEFSKYCTARDSVLPVSNFDRSWDENSTEPDAVIFERARIYEEKYQLNYMQDIIQQDRIISFGFLNVAPNAGFPKRTTRPLVQIFDYINRCFAFHEKFQDDEKIELIIGRAGGLSDTVMIEVATRRQIPSTFLHGSFFGRRAQWTAGPYMSPAAMIRRYQETPPQEPATIANIEPGGGWNQPKPESLRKLLTDIAKAIVISLQFTIRDIHRRKKGRRVPLATVLWTLIQQFRVRCYLDRVSEKDIDKIASRPFLYVAMPDEPEFTVQSMCREFADVRAWFRQVALSLPSGVVAVFKAHQRVGNRSRSFYEELLRFPNTIIAHHSLRGVDLVARCLATFTLGGSTPVEAGQFGKRAIVFGNRNSYSFLPHVRIVDGPGEMAAALREAVRPLSAVESSEIRSAVARFRVALEPITFDASGTPLFLFSTRTKIEPKEVSKAVDALLFVSGCHKDSLGSKARSKSAEKKVLA